MFTATRHVVALLKLRIGVMIAASACAGMAAADGPAMSTPDAMALALAVLGASGAAGAFNHYHERDIDAAMRRTRDRPFASGALTPGAWWLAGFLALLAASLVLAAAVGGAMSALYVFLGAFTYGIVYTVWLKRRSTWNIIVGGLAGSFAVMAGAAAVDPDPQVLPVALALVLFLWTPPHFWSLAAARADDYRAAGVPMLPIVAPTRVWTLAIFAHTLALLLVSLVPLVYGKGLLYALGALAGGGYFLWTSWRVVRAPGADTAMANFKASLYQLAALVIGTVLDAGAGSLP